LRFSKGVRSLTQNDIGFNRRAQALLRTWLKFSLELSPFNNYDGAADTDNGCQDLIIENLM